MCCFLAKKFKGASSCRREVTGLSLKVLCLPWNSLDDSFSAVARAVYAFLVFIHHQLPAGCLPKKGTPLLAGAVD